MRISRFSCRPPKSVHCTAHHPHVWWSLMQHIWLKGEHFVGLVQDCNISSVLAMEILQSCTESLISHDISQWTTLSRCYSMAHKVVPLVLFSNTSLKQFIIISMAWCRTAITPLLTHWSYCSLALTQRCTGSWLSGVAVACQRCCTSDWDFGPRTRLW